MTRQLPLTPTEAEKFKALPAGESMWIVREGMCSLCIEGGNDHESYGVGPCAPNVESLEFWRACAPCETCEDHRSLWHIGTMKNGRPSEWRPCPDCRIELVGPCPEPIHLDNTGCTGTVTLGYAHAVGQPLPIIRGWARPDGDSSGDVLSFWPGHYGPACVMQRAWNATAIQTQYADRTTALAHYGDPSTLVGRWALELAVTQ